MTNAMIIINVAVISKINKNIIFVFLVSGFVDMPFKLNYIIKHCKKI
jgi:hypothetical protein